MSLECSKMFRLGPVAAALLLVFGGFCGLAGAVQGDADAAGSCAAGMEMAQGEIRRGDDAAARNRWADASRAYRAADARLRDLEDRCGHDIAEKAAAAIDDLLTKRAAAEVEAPGAGCAQALGEARGRGDAAAAQASRSSDAAEVERLFVLADEAWDEAAAVCDGEERQKALAGKADIAQARARLASSRSVAACEPAIAAAERLVESGKTAWNGKAWPEAARWLRQAEAAWAAAVEKCSGPQRDRAMTQKTKAAGDARNATQCMPAWDLAERLSADHQALAPQAAGSRREALRSQAESAWRDAAAGCPDDSRDSALARADALARQRASEPPPVMETRVAAPSPPPAVPSQTELEPVKRAAAVPTPTPPPVPVPPAPAAVRAEPTEAPAVPKKSFEQVVAGVAAKAAGFLDRTVAGAATALGLSVEGETLRVGTTTYTGDFRRDPAGGTVSGQGKVEWNNGDVFVGTLVQGKAEGRGSMAWRKTGSRYEGDWRNDLQNGRGTMTFGDGTRYVGDFVDGHLSGRGRYDYAGIGESYEGEVLDGKPHGQGTYTWKSGDRYDGAWQAGRKSGQGRYTWTDGSYWEGEYENDERTENGRTVFPIPSR